jgi:hypothetical protein
MPSGFNTNGIFAACRGNSSISAAMTAGDGNSAVFHIPIGFLILLGPICLAMIILLTIELVVVRPANREDSLARQSARGTEASRSGSKYRSPWSR